MIRDLEYDSNNYEESKMAPEVLRTGKKMKKIDGIKSSFKIFDHILFKDHCLLDVEEKKLYRSSELLFENRDPRVNVHSESQFGFMSPFQTPQAVQQKDQCLKSLKNYLLKIASEERERNCESDIRIAVERDFSSVLVSKNNS